MRVGVVLGSLALVGSLAVFPGMPSWADDSPAEAVAAPTVSADASSPAPSEIPTTPTPSVETPTPTATPTTPAATPTPTTPAPTPTPTTPAATPTPTTPAATPTPTTPAATPTPTLRAGLQIQQRLELSRDRDGDGRADNGDGVRVIATVVNSGAVPLGSVMVTDSLVGRLGSSVTCGSRTLAPGASTTCRSGSVRVTRAQATARQFRNQVRATARTASGSLVRSAQSTATLTVQPLHKQIKHRHVKHRHVKHRHVKHRHVKHRHVKHQHVKHQHQHVKHRHFRRQHVKKPTAHLALRQYVSKIFDMNDNGRLEAGDSVQFGFGVSNTGSFAVDDVHIMGRRLTRFEVPVECGTTHLAPGDSTVCSSGRLKITSFQAKKGLGRNFAYALARTSNGTEVRSNSSVITLVRSTSQLRGQLPDTGADITLGQLRWAGLAVLVGGGLMIVSRRRRRETHESGHPL